MSRIAAAPLLVLLVTAGQHTRAAELAEVISLSCDGTKEWTGGLGEPTGKPLEPVKKMGLILNFTEHTVVGFQVFGGFDAPAHIDVVNDTRVEFSSSVVKGAIDRVTGSAWVFVNLATKTRFIGADKYELVCKVTNRLF
jgi:hypothetical protein